MEKLYLAGGLVYERAVLMEDGEETRDVHRA